jgi:hypothetical protein
MSETRVHDMKIKKKKKKKNQQKYHGEKKSLKNPMRFFFKEL